LVYLLNMLASSLIYKADALTLDHIYTELEEYAVYHFQTEEQVWHQYLAGEACETEHKKTHENFVADLLKLKDAENSKPLYEVLEEVFAFLTHWLTFHILDSDMRMSRLVLAVQSGMSREQAMQQSPQGLNKETEVLVNTVLSMNEALSNRTLQLMKEVMDHQKTETLYPLAANSTGNGLESTCITDREREVMMLVIAGYTSKEIAQRLAISTRTVETHRAHIMRKTGASNLVELTRFANGEKSSQSLER